MKNIKAILEQFAAEGLEGDWSAIHDLAQQELQRPVTPLLAVDIIIEIQDWFPFTYGGFTITAGDRSITSPEIKLPEPGIVLIERKNPPAGWALPGGFVDIGEDPVDAAIREAKEETGLDITSLSLMGVYGNPKRDPRGHTVSIVYRAAALGWPKGQDDAKEAIVVNPLKLGDIRNKLCFDHGTILTDYVLSRK
jgi:8-oxo-dGTP diphosphatase